MKKLHLSAIILLPFLFVSCAVLNKVGKMKEDGKIDIVLVQVNDVYEIAPLDAGKSGGMARVAFLKKAYQKQNANTLLVMAGDFVSPSVYNGLRYGEEYIRGRQMIEVMNAAGVDIAGFGNHEFDISEKELQQRINESKFNWVSSNSFHDVNGTMAAFEKHNRALPQYIIRTFTDADGTTARVGFIGINIPFNKAAYVMYKDPFAAATTVYNQIKDSCDAVVAITHQLMEDDIKLAHQLPGLAVILGGHEHDMRMEKAGNIYITKAHANARSAFVVKMQIDVTFKRVTVQPAIKMLDESVGLDSATSLVVKKWIRIADSSFSASGFKASEVLIKSGDSLEARETVTRTAPTNLTRIIAAAMEKACPDANLALFNAGALRLDDVLHPPVTTYDVLRTLPYGGAVREADITGGLLIKVLDAGRMNKGSGGFLQYSSFVKYNQEKKQWSIRDKPVDPKKIYKVALNDFLVSGKEANLSFLNEKNYEMYRLYNAATGVDNPKSDIRLALVKYLETLN